jgi:hypothetical protein
VGARERRHLRALRRQRAPDLDPLPTQLGDDRRQRRQVVQPDEEIGHGSG